MARGNFVETITLPTGPGGSLIPVPGIQATPYTINTDGSEGSVAPAYAARTGSTPAPSLETDSTGVVSFWLDDGDYDIRFEDTESTPRISPFTRGFTAAVLSADALITAAEGVLFFTGDYKFTNQASDHGLKADGSYEWLLVMSAGDGGGRFVPQATYPDLWVALGSGPIDSSGNFRLPNLSGRTFVVTGNASGLSSYTPLDFVGEELHTLIVAELANHDHPIGNAATGVEVDYGNPLYAGQQAAVTAAALTGTQVIASAGVAGGPTDFVPVILPYGAVDWGGRDLNHNHPTIDPEHNHPMSPSGGGDTGHNNIQPSVGMNCFIKT